MAGEIEEQIRHDFQAGSFHSGSISFGRFESEILCWERRSSFSHNRYLEEVEKCSKPGSVTEKKAYFEAHFRKKGILPVNSPSEIKYQTSENDYDEGINQIKNSLYGTSICDARLDPSCRSKLGSFSENEVRENLDGEESNFGTSHVSNVTIDSFIDDHAKSERCSSPKEKCTKPKSVSSKGSEEKTKKNVNNVVTRSKVENETSKASAQEKQLMRKIAKNESGSKAKGDNYIKRSEKISRNRRIEEARSSTLLMVSSRVQQSENRINSAIGLPQRCIKQDNSRLSFKCNELAERRKEFDKKLKEKMHSKEAQKHQRWAKTQEKTEAELKQLQRSLNFKAKPLPSFYRGALRDSDRNKATANNAKRGKIRTNCSSTGTKVSESSSKTNDILPEASGATSCHSTLTSDSSPSSPRSGQPCRAVINSKETEKDKIKMTNKGKKMEGKEKKRTGHKTAVLV